MDKQTFLCWPEEPGIIEGVSDKTAQQEPSQNEVSLMACPLWHFLTQDPTSNPHIFSMRTRFMWFRPTCRVESTLTM